MRYVAARCKEYDRDEAYRIYVTDGLKHLVGADRRYYDMVHEPVETRSAEEIKNDIFNKLNSLGGGA